MTQWAKPPEYREQQVLFPLKLDEAVPTQHPVRLFDEILGRLDWPSWEAQYHPSLGQPAIHPRVLASILLYGLLNRIRSSRLLERATQMQLDFRWLAHGHAPDHTTLSEFRRKFGDELKNLFVQIGLIAREMQFWPMACSTRDLIWSSWKPPRSRCMRRRRRPILRTIPPCEMTSRNRSPPTSSICCQCTRRA